MTDEPVLEFCPGCKASNTGKKKFCPECGASLIRSETAPTITPLKKTPDAEDQQRIRRNNMLIGGGAIIILLIVVLFVSGIGPSIGGIGGISGQYKMDNCDDNSYISKESFSIYDDGTYGGMQYFPGIWKVDEDKLYFYERAIMQQRYSSTPTHQFQITNGKLVETGKYFAGRTYVRCGPATK